MPEESVEATAESTSPSEQAENLGEKMGFPKVVESARRIYNSARKSDNFWAALPYSVLAELDIQKGDIPNIDIPPEIRKVLGNVEKLFFPNKIGLRTVMGGIAGGLAVGGIHLIKEGKAPSLPAIGLYMAASASAINHILENQ